MRMKTARFTVFILMMSLAVSLMLFVLAPAVFAFHKDFEPIGYTDVCEFWVDVRSGVAADREAGVDMEESFERMIIKMAESHPKVVTKAPVHFEDVWDSGLTYKQEVIRTKASCLVAFGHIEV